MSTQRMFELPPFDPNATFRVSGWPDGFTVNGRQPKRGDIFDKSSVRPEMLRAHYSARWLDMLSPDEVAAIPREPHGELDDDFQKILDAAPKRSRKRG